MDLEQDIARIAEQEQRLRLSSFNEETAWDLGSGLRALAIARHVAVTIEVRLARTMPSRSPFSKVTRNSPSPHRRPCPWQCPRWYRLRGTAAPAAGS